MTGSEILVVIIVAGVLIGVWIFLQQKAKTRLQQIEQETGSQTVLYKDRSANFFGQASRGYKQVRGNGVLLITREQIMFHMWVPEKKLIIPVESMISYESPKSFLGKTKLSRLIQINFYNNSGEKDAAAWLTRDLECINVLETLKSHKEGSYDEIET